MKRSSVVYVARYWLARAYDLRGLDADALRLANVLLGMYPNETSALVIRLRVEAREGDTRAALADFRQIERTKDVAVTAHRFPVPIFMIFRSIRAGRNEF